MALSCSGALSCDGALSSKEYSLNRLLKGPCLVMGLCLARMIFKIESLGLVKGPCLAEGSCLVVGLCLAMIIL